MAVTIKKKTLASQLEAAQAEVRADGYEMSFGELISIYERGEIRINPSYQRLFRWSQEQKSKFIESILIGIPIPPIFVFQDKDGKWELVDGLQRLSTILEFRGALRRADKKRSLLPGSRLLGTALLPSLEDIGWESSKDGKALPDELKLRLLRARVRIEILQTGSSARSRFELFQRLNTGGSLLTQQEIRTCSVIMVDPDFQAWLEKLSKVPEFAATTALTEIAKEKQRPVELVVKYFVYGNIKYRSEWDVHEYLDEGIVELALSKSFDRQKAEAEFRSVFKLLNSELGPKAFRRTVKGKSVGSFSDAAFEAVAVGVGPVVKEYEGQPDLLKTRVSNLWAEEDFKKHTGAGVRGTTRLQKIVPFARDYFKV